MKSKHKIAVFGIVALVVSGSLGVSAYQSFTVERDASIDVVADSSGVIALTPGQSQFVFSQNGEMQISVARGGAEGINTNSQMIIGNPSDATNRHAFTVTNNYDGPRDMEFSYSASQDSSSADNVQYTLYTSNGQVGQFSEETNLTQSAVPAGRTFYAVVEIDTTDSTPSDNLSGTLSVQAS